MKKKITALLLVCCMVIPFGVISGITPMADTPANTVYLSDSGNDENGGTASDTAFKTITKAYQTLGSKGGVIEIVGTFTPAGNFIAPAHTGKITIKGHDSASKYVISGATRRFQAGGPTEFTDITIEQNKDMLFVARFNDFTVSSTVKHVKNAGNSYIVAGGQGGTVKANDGDYTPKSVTLTVNAGNWSEVIGTYRSSLNSPSGTHSTSEFKNYTVTVNIGGSTAINRIAAFSRVANNSEFVAEGSECIINLNGGTVAGWICQSDSRKSNSKNGYEKGITVYVGKNFNFADSFTLDADKQNAEHVVADSAGNQIFYGFSGDNVFLNHDLNPIGKSTLVIAPELFDSLKDSTRFRGFASILSGVNDAPETDAPETDAPETDAPETDAPETDAPETDAPVVPESPSVVYLSDSGSETNSGTSADKPFNTITKCYEALGDKGGEIVITGTFTQKTGFMAPSHTGKITVRGKDVSAVYSVGGYRYQSGGPLEFTDITIKQTATNFMIVGCYNDLTISSTVKHDKTGNSFLVAGGQGGAGSADRDYDVKSATLTINGGDWNDVIGSVRSSINSPSGAHSKTEFKDYLITINVGGNAVIGKIAAFSRNFGSAEILAANSQCVVNLNGGKVTAWIGMSDATTLGKNGYENGLIVNIGKDFDFEACFLSDIDKQVDNVVTDAKGYGIFYGISGDNVFTTGGYGAIGVSKVYIADEKYDAYKDSGRLRDVTVEKGAFTPALPETPEDPDDTTEAPDDTTQTPDTPVVTGKVVYLSDNGNDANDGLSAATPVKTITKAYKTLGNNGGTVVITDKFTPAAHFIAVTHAGKITIRGLTQDSRYIISGATRRFLAGGPTEFTDITIEQNKDMLFVANYNVFTISSTVKHVKNSGNAFIVAGGQGGTGKTSDRRYLVRSTELTVNAGTWSEIIGSVRTNLKSPDRTHPVSEFNDYSVVINVGGTAQVAKIAAFSRSVTTAVFAKKAECVINLNGGKVTHWIAMHDFTGAAKHGYEDGMIVNIGQGFNLAASFQGDAGKQVDNIVTDAKGNMIFYGISGDGVFVNDAHGKIGASKVYIHESQYDALKDSSRFRGVEVLSGAYTAARAPETGDSLGTIVVAAALMSLCTVCAVAVIRKKRYSGV